MIDRKQIYLNYNLLKFADTTKASLIIKCVVIIVAYNKNDYHLIIVRQVINISN